MKEARLPILLIGLMLVTGAPSVGKEANKSAGSSKQSDGVVVKKNSDGSVEVSDEGGDGSTRASSSDGESAPTTTGGGITYKHKGEGSMKYGDGVTYKRHADGSVEVFDEDTVHPVMHSLGAPLLHLLPGDVPPPIVSSVQLLNRRRTRKVN